MIQINPTPAGFPQKEATKLKVLMLQTDTTETTMNTYWQLLTEQGEQLAEGNYRLTEEEYAGYGFDPAYVDDLVMVHLGLTRKEE